MSDKDYRTRKYNTPGLIIAPEERGHISPGDNDAYLEFFNPKSDKMHLTLKGEYLGLFNSKEAALSKLRSTPGINVWKISQDGNYLLLEVEAHAS